ncbi:MAG: hypothetical protein H6858_04655 [Rhodospirillales bacterium]|nr:hypothetical protein [Alphaproteobacteria bacterium]MCB9976876.1 hypothetical protein [Rhodospirillales bacterium]
MLKEFWEYRFGVLFATLMVLLFSATIALQNRFEEEIFMGVFSLVLIASVNALYRKTFYLTIFLGIGALSFFMNIVTYFSSSMDIEIEALTVNLIFLLCAIAIMFNHIFNGSKVDANLLLGAASLYLLMGVCFAYMYTIVDYFFPASFSGALTSGTHGIHALFAQFFYYSFVTLATVGYGDIMPVSQEARFLSLIEAILSQLYMTILIARLVGMHLHHSK